MLQTPGQSLGIKNNIQNKFSEINIPFKKINAKISKKRKNGVHIKK